MAFQAAGNDPRHGLIAIAHKYLFAVANELNMGAELSSTEVCPRLGSLPHEIGTLGRESSLGWPGKDRP
jgi:hypothetical protein